MTEGARPQGQFAASDVHLSLALRAARMVAWEWDVGLNRIALTGDAAGLFGLPQRFEGDLVEAIIHPDDLPAHNAVMRTARQGENAYRVEFRLVRPDTGQVVWVEERGEVLRDASGEPLRIVGVLMDIHERKRAEAERVRLLDEARAARAEADAERARLREIFARAPAAIAVAEGPEYIYSYANPRYRELVGRRDLIGKPVREAIPEVEERFLDLLAAVYTTGEPFVGTEVPIHLERGGERHEEFLNFVYAPVRGMDGAVTGIMAHVVEVTAQVRARQRMEALAAENARLLADAQAAQAEAEAVRGRLAAVVEQIPAGVIIAEAPSGRIVFGNAQVERITGHPVRYSDDTTRYTADWAAHHADGRRVQPDEWPLARAIRTGAIVTGEEYRYRRGDDTPAWVQLDAAPIRDGAGAVVAGVVILTDITARKATEAALRESEARLLYALDAGAMGAWSWDIATGAVAWSDNIEAMHGLTPGGFDGTFGGFLARVHPDDRAGVQDAIAAALRQGDAYSVAFRVVRENGAVRRIEGRGRILRGANGAATGIAGLVTDVTERWEAEAERERLLEAERAARAEAEAAVRARDTFLSVAAHELKTPVTALKGNAQLLLRQQARGVFDPDRLARSLRGMDRATDRLATLTDDLLDVSRIRTGQLPLALEPTDMHALLREATERAADGRDGRHRLVLDLPPVLPRVPLDPARIEQVLTNLLGNAVKYAPDGGAITTSAWEADGGVAVRVRDEGIGLPAGASETIFAPFGRAANAVAHNFPGMGLGLYICRNIVKRHGGRMWAESDGEDRGTAVTFWLPCEAARGREGAGNDG